MFLINRGEIIERFDANYYSALNTLNIANNSVYPVKKLFEVSFLQRGKFSHRPRNDARFYDGEYPFIQTGDIVKASQNNDKIIFTQTLNELGLSVSKLFQPNILIITIAANIGDTAILTYPACFPDSLVTITPKNPEVSVRYLNVYFKYVKDYLVNLAPQSAQKNINLQQLSPTPVVIPPPEIQANIVSIFEMASLSRKQKEAEAASLLASIDGYLLQELGIILPPPSEKKTYFLTRSSQISGGRFDALSHSTDIFSAFKTSKYNLVAIKEISNYLKTGFAAGKQDQDLEEIGVIQIRPTNVKEPERGLTFDRNIYIKLSEIETRNLDLLQRNEVLFNNTNSQELVGKTTLFSLEGDYFCSNHMTRIGVNEEVDSVYLTHILNLYQHLRVFYRMCVNWNNQSGVNTEMLKSIKVPLPPLEKQTEIANHISALRTQAKQLQQQAAAELAQAKLHVEQLILGETT